MHVIVAVDGPAKQQERFMEFFNKRKYPMEGQYRKGYNKPFISEVKLYEIRIKKECLTPFLQDMRNWGGGITLYHEHLGWIGKTIFKIMKLFSRFLPIKIPDVGKLIDNPDKSEYPTGWLYSHVLFTLDDPEEEEGELL